MMLSTKSTYGLRAVLAIALEDTGEAMPIATISRAEGISQDYLEQLLNKLRREGLVKSVRGPKGGYILSRAPDKITVRDVVRSLEGEISPVHCVTAQGRAQTSCRMSNHCVPKTVWKKLAKSISECLGAITIKDLCKEAKKKRG